MGRGLADDDRAPLRQRFHDVGVGGRQVPEVGRRTVAGLHALGVDQVLDRDGQPFQRPLPILGVATVTLRRRLERAVPVDGRECIDGSLAGFRLVERLLRQRRRGYLPRRQGVERPAQPGWLRGRAGRLQQITVMKVGMDVRMGHHHMLSSSASSFCPAWSPRSPTSAG
ncbi:hypothetical protein D3C86_1462810 [compost metagenome]